MSDPDVGKGPEGADTRSDQNSNDPRGDEADGEIDTTSRPEEDLHFNPERVANLTDRFVHIVELMAAAVFAVLFAIGVIDLALQIVQSAMSGRITDPLVVIGFIDTGLLLLIIVEVYQTVIAYTRESETRQIVRLVIYTGVIAMVRKAIIFRTGEYGSTQSALFASLSYTILLLGLTALLLVERVYATEGTQ